MKIDKAKLLVELDALTVLLDESNNLFNQRIDFALSGQKQKVKYIDERIYPVIDKRISQQTKKVLELIDNHEHDYERQTQS